MEVNCETDFVARGDKFKELLADLVDGKLVKADVREIVVMVALQPFFSSRFFQLEVVVGKSLVVLRLGHLD